MERHWIRHQDRGLRFGASFVFALALACALSSTVASAAPSLPEDFTVEGRLYDASGNPIATSADFKLEIVDELNPGCVLYREYRTADLSAADPTARGVFSFRLGAVPPAFSVASFVNLFSPGAQSGEGGCSFTAQPGSHRLIHVSVKNSSDTTYEALGPDTKITAVPLAKVAENALSLQGVGTSGLVLVNPSSDLKQSNLEDVFSLVNFPKLQALLAGTSSAYLPGTPTSAVGFNGQRLTGIQDPTAAQDAATKNYADTMVAGHAVDVSAVGPMTGNNSTLLWDATANKWVAGAINTSPTGTAGGDLTNSYPNPTIRNDVITAAKIASTGGGVNRLLITDATTGAAIGYGVCATNEVYAWTATGWACTSVAMLSPVTSVNNHTGAVTLAASDITGFGTAALYDWGTAANQIPRLDGTGRMPAVDGSQLYNVNTTQLQSRPVSGATPSAGQVLGFNGTAWLPTTAASGTVTNVAGGTGLIGGSITSTGTLSVDVGTSASKIVQLDAAARLPALDGSQLTSVNATRLATRIVSSATPANAQVLGWNQTTSVWEPQTTIVNAVTSLTGGNGIFGGIITSTGTISVDSGTAASKIVQLNGNAQSVLAPGSDAKPTYSFAGSTDVGLFSPGTGQLAIATAGSARLTITPTGVGIGTTSPESQFAVNGTSSSTLTRRTDATTGWTAALNLRGDSSGDMIDNFGAALTFSIRDNSGVDNMISHISGRREGADNSGNLVFATGNNGTVSAKMLLSSRGNLGIGTSIPQAALDVASNGTTISAILVPRDSTSNRPTIPVNGMIRYNTQLNAMEGYINNGWATFAAGSSAGTVTSITAGKGLLGGPITTTGSIAVDVGTAANQIVQLDPTGRLPAVDGSQLKNVNADRIGNHGIVSNDPTANGQVLAWNSAASLWAPATPNAGTVTSVSAGPGLTGGPITSSGALSVDIGSAGSKIPALNASAQLALGDGSATSPTYSFHGSTNSGLFRAGQDLAFSLGGNQQFTFKANGNLGIGTSAPTLALEVNGTGAASAILLPRDASTNRPTGVNGALRYASDLNKFEGYQNGAWAPIVTGSAASGQIAVANAAGIRGSANFKYDESSGLIVNGTSSSANAIQVGQGVSSFYGTVNVNGPTNLTGNQLFQGGSTTITSSLSITGVTALSNSLSVSGSSSFSGALFATGSSSFSGALVANGTSTFKGPVVQDVQSLTPGPTTIDGSLANVFSTSNPCGGSTKYTLSNMINGGTYTIVNTDGGTAKCDFAGAGGTSYTFYFMPANDVRVSGAQTIYNLLVVGNKVYVSWSSGFQ